MRETFKVGAVASEGIQSFIDHVLHEIHCVTALTGVSPYVAPTAVSSNHKPPTHPF